MEMRKPAWQKDTPQVRGRKVEARAAKKLGARVHPMSGAGSEKDDFSTDEEIYEFKNPGKSHTISGAKLNEQLRRAYQQGKTAKYVIYFDDSDVTLEGTLYRGFPKKSS